MSNYFSYTLTVLTYLLTEVHNGGEGGEDELWYGGCGRDGTPALRVKIEPLPGYGKAAALQLGVGSPKAKGRKP